MLNCIKKGAAARVTEVPIKERGRLQSSRLKPMIFAARAAWLKAMPSHILIPFYAFTGARSNACMVVRIVEITLSLPTAVLIIM